MQQINDLAIEQKKTYLRIMVKHGGCIEGFKYLNIEMNTFCLKLTLLGRVFRTVVKLVALMIRYKDLPYSI